MPHSGLQRAPTGHLQPASLPCAFLSRLTSQVPSLAPSCRRPDRFSELALSGVSAAGLPLLRRPLIKPGLVLPGSHLQAPHAVPEALDRFCPAVSRRAALEPCYDPARKPSQVESPSPADRLKRLPGLHTPRTSSSSPSIISSKPFSPIPILSLSFNLFLAQPRRRHGSTPINQPYLPPSPHPPQSHPVPSIPFQSARSFPLSSLSLSTRQTGFLSINPCPF